MPYDCIDLFAGIGGIRLGFENAFGDQLSTVFVSEWDKFAQRTYAANFQDNFEIAGDIREVDEHSIPNFDICLAGFPCQAFSLAGHHLGFEDNYYGVCRGTLFQEVARICREKRPRVIFCENVKGLVHHDHGRTLEVILGTFSELGYKVFTTVLNSKYFGVPQNRERVYIVAFRDDIHCDNFSFPEEGGEITHIRDILQEAPIPSKYYLSTGLLGTLRRHKERHVAKGNGFGYQIRDWDGVAGALICGGMGRERNLVVDAREHSMIPTTHIKGEINPENIRRMTPREWARLQGFPDNYRFVVSDASLYKQFGNSVTVNVIEAIAAKIREVLESPENNNDAR